ncbi:MAG: hypothetical protein U0869_17605 [Chloroflexota bacterium]
MVDQDRSGTMDQDPVGEAAEGLLAQQTPGLDTGETSAIAGPDWDEDLVRDAAGSMPGETLEGDVETGPMGETAATTERWTAGDLQGGDAAMADLAGNTAGGVDLGGGIGLPAEAAVGSSGPVGSGELVHDLADGGTDAD